MNVSRMSFRLTLVLLTIIMDFSVDAAESFDFSPPPFQVPDGFTIEVVAAPPLVKYPMMACFDERGRLFIAETLGNNLDKQQLLARRCRFIRMLEDTDQDGKFDKSTIFADKLVMPEGALWHRGSLYVLSSPYLWRFEDTDDDGVADVREKLVGYMDFTGQANQHGAYLGPNGRLYFSGGHLGYDLKSKDGQPVAKGRAAAVFSCRPDGTDLQVFGNGGINPVEVAFTPDGELLTTCPIFDSIGGRHDALIHWVRGATAGPKDYAPPVLKQTGYRLPALRRWGQVAPSGLTRYRSTTFGQKYENSFFATHFNTATVANVRLKRVGSTFEGTDEDFVTSTSRDFHPTDVIEDADGSLLMIDTGGWFLISCPFSKVSKPEIMGAIYRIKRQDTTKPVDPRGLQIDWQASSDQLLTHLDDPRPVVRDRTVEVLAARGDEAVRTINSQWNKLSEQQRRNAVWSLSRIESEAATEQLRMALNDSYDSVIQAATRSVGFAKDEQSVSSLVKLLAHELLPLRRMAATALGQIGDARAVPQLLSTLTMPGDDHLRHALVYALIEIDDVQATAEGLNHADPRVQHAALVALDQMDSGSLSREQVSPLLGSNDEVVKLAAIEILTARPEWSNEMIQILDDWSNDRLESSLNDELISTAIVTFKDNQQVQEIARHALTSAATTPKRRQQLLKSVERIRELPPSWLPALRKLLKEGDASLRLDVIAAISASRTNQLNEDLRQAGTDASNDRQVRLAAWICLAECGTSLPDLGFDSLLLQVETTEIPLDRLAAARAISRANLTRKQLRRLIDALPAVGSAELSTLLNKVESSLANAPELTQKLIAARTELSSKPTPSQATDREMQERIELLLETLGTGDAKHGEVIFRSTRAACSACHAVNNSGGDTGPDLSQIGSIRRRPDFLEAILYPNSSIVNSFETYSVLLKDGRIEQGVIQRADAKWLVLRDGQRRDITLSRESIEELERVSHSIMPQGLATHLSSDELSDLLAYLASLGRTTDD